jgi:hypothetical protein
MERLGLPNVRRLLDRRRAARLLGKPQTDFDRQLAQAERLFKDDPRQLRLHLMFLALQHLEGSRGSTLQ